MKIFRILGLLITAGMIMVACEGPEGPRGAAGTNGVDGIDGTDGNANVMYYGFPGQVVGASNTYLTHTLPLTYGFTDSSIVLPYLYYSAMWYQIGQIGPNGDFLTRYFITGGATETNVYTRILNLDGTTYSGVDYTIDSFRIFVVPASVFHMAEDANVDFSNYREVNAYFGQK